jgi:hypothetical protein
LDLTIHLIANSEHYETLARSLPQTFSEAVNWVKTDILAEFDREITQKQLYYHDREHIDKVRSRSQLIFSTIVPHLSLSLEDRERMELLLDLCAVAHDAIQIFLPLSQPHTSRQREAGRSERMTIDMLFNYIHHLHRQLTANGIDRSVQFSDIDLAVIKEAIESTICAYDPEDKAIYQSALYEDCGENLSLVTKIIALADIGSLGMEGIAAYNREGGLLFLEENPDLIPFLTDNTIDSLEIDRPELAENIRQRLLRRANFQVNFARSRLRRLPQEIASFPVAARSQLKVELFPYLNNATITQIEEITPVDIDRSLKSLVEFFQLKELFKERSVISPQPSATN